MFTSQSGSFIVLFGLTALVLAFNEVPGPSCEGTGNACSYSYVSGGGDTVTVNGFCAPNGFCADNGAACTTSDQCYDYCGNGVCGGLGATCDSTDAFSHNQFSIACYTDGGYTCNADGSTGQCVLSASLAARKRARQQLSMGPRPVSCRRDNDSLCPSLGGLTGEMECVDLASDFENCGQCGIECGSMEGGAVVECVQGKCLAMSCRRGWTLLDDECVRSITPATQV
ncbi:hypothetical protein DACRYDRAFT_107740 [Dacryopinax primogenitus]|uniref:Protein CPL1-like domain-containing protein n=1 Tax=Dacryopinax primogenitus (strain DJM 731) TaxID=1858805 RepID=M5FZT1_DACPD|nr:uncharacterized protein DACRYDRAFT_107740 [Dacryopinax primogenitus]EJU02019.1 hypothetical protein DACRYDRAFT_107740 [Dacryopinax primogenitus]